MSKEYFSESDINNICNKISNPFSNEIIHFQVCIKNLLQKIKKFLEQKRKSPNFKPDEFVKIVINHINSHKVTANTHVGILAAQSIGEPVTQSALSYFHKLTGDDTINDLKEVIIHQTIKQYLKDSNNILGKWDSSFNLENLYIEFKNPASKILDWLDSNGIEYTVEEDILCVYKVKENCPNNVINLESDDDYNDKYVLSDNEQNKNEWKYEENFHTQNKNDEESHIEIKNDSNITNDSLLDYFKINNLTFEEKENYYIFDSNYVEIKYEKIFKLLNDISLTGTKGVKTVSSKMLGEEEFYVEVVGRNLDPLFENQYIDLDRSRYTVYGTSKQVDHNTRKQNILEQLKRITNIDKSYYNNQHIELLTNIMCRNDTIVPMSRFGMKNDDYSFISKLSFEDPYSVLENILYGVEDSLSSVSAKIITGIYNDKI
ncbi:hypothetical protein H8356DRAFT_1299623 [Neocallimastix lanati (nom. inval.)]|nr:hypothetical protein H8356DRAFT_1299623 [Neocallimastix sp. JGI-2020a]